MILPGSKSTIAGLALCAARASTSTSPRICGAAARDRAVRRLSDAGAAGRRSGRRRRPGGDREGLGLLDVETVLTSEKTLVSVKGATGDGMPFAGYEMHMGRPGPGLCASVRQVDGKPEGAVSVNGRVSAPMCTGCSPTTGSARLAAAARRGARAVAYDEPVETTLDRLARISQPSSISTGSSPSSDDDGEQRDQRDQKHVGAAIEHQRLADVLRIGLRGRRCPSRRRRRRRRHRRAGRRAKGRARRPSPPPASRRWASGDGARRAHGSQARRGGAGHDRRRPRRSAARDSREAGRLTRSSRRADAQPNASWRGVRWPIMLSAVLTAL